MSPCHACGREMPPDARFCPWCGAAATLSCAVCDSPLPEGAAYCPACGTPAPASATAQLPAPGSQQTGAAAPLRPVPALGREDRRLVTVLFADLVGSTGLSERLGPERMRDLMHAYFEAVRTPLAAEGGTVEKFIGDAVMAAFGVPDAHEDDAERALRAALKVRAAVADLAADFGAQHGIEWAVRIGVTTGEVIAEAEPALGEPLVTGDAVNVAARLQAAAEPGEILVAARTARAARGFGYGPVRSMQVRGRAAPVSAFPLLAGGEAAERGIPGLWAPLIGRDLELELLAELLRRTREEQRPHLVTLYGDAGVGKSRLVREFLERAAANDVTMLQGRCLPYGNAITYYPLGQVLAADAGVSDDDPASVAIERIHAAVHRHATPETATDDLAPIAEALAFTLGLALPEWRISRMDATGAQRALHRAWVAYLAMLAADAPLILVIEDIHWAESALLDLLEELADRVTAPLLLVCPARPDLLSRRPTWGGGRRNASSISLEPLAEAESHDLLAALVMVDDLPESLRARILGRSEGNPFFLEEILRQLIDTGAIGRQGEHWLARPGIEDVEIPDSVQAALAGRIGLLSPSDRALLQAAAVVGRTFWAEPAGLLAGIGQADRLDEALQRLQERDLVGARIGSSFRGQTELQFKHILTRDVAYESIPRRERVAAHATVGAWIEQVTGDRAPEFSELLASHYATAIEIARQDEVPAPEGLRRSAQHWLVTASTAQCGAAVFDKALRLAERALTLSDTPAERCEAESALGLVHSQALRGQDSWIHYLRAAEAAEEAELDPLRRAQLIADALEMPLRWPGIMQSEPDEPLVRRLWEQAERLAGPAPTRQRAKVLALKASWPFAYPAAVDEADFEHYRATGVEAAEMAHALGDVDLESMALDAASGVDSYRGDYQSALQIWRRRWELLGSVSDDHEFADILGMGGWTHWELGNYEAGLAVIDHLGERFDRPDLVHALSWRGACRFQLGRWDEVLADYAVMLESLGGSAADPPLFATLFICQVGAVHALRGNQERSDAIARQMLGRQERAPVAQGAMALLALSRGDLHTAEQHLLDRPAAWRIHAGTFLQGRCDTALAARDWSRALDTAEEALKHAGAQAIPSLLGAGLRLRGSALAAAGDSDGVPLLQRAVAQFDALDVPLDAMRTLRLLAAAHERRGEAESAAQARQRAEALRRQLRIVADPLFEF